MKTVDVFINCDDEFRTNFSKNSMTYKKFYPIYLFSDNEFKRAYTTFLNRINFRLWIHLEYRDDVNNSLGLAVGQSIKDEFPNISLQFITRKTKITEISGFKVYYMYNTQDFNWSKYDFSEIPNNKPIENDTLLLKNAKIRNVENNNLKDNYDFAIITALYKDEFQKIKPLFNWDEKPFETSTKRYYTGSLKDFPEKRIVAAIQSATGMVDASIIATEILELFKPRYLFMTGVCGGKDDDELNFGDIIIADKVFTFQKGKLSDLKDSDDNIVDLFEVEYSPVEINSLVKDKIEPHLYEICHKIKNDLIDGTYSEYNVPELKAIIAPMACSTMVINKEGYFENKIKILERKTVAVEMESYGVVKACMIANNGNTTPVIIKSIMDKTKKKDDRAKPFAAYTSAHFLKYLIYDGILD